MRSVAVDGDGGTKNGGWRWVTRTPGAPGGDDAGTEGQEMGMLHMEVHSYLGHKARPGHLFTSSTLKNINNIHLTVSVTHTHSTLTLYTNAETSVHAYAQSLLRKDRPTFSPTSNPSL